MDKQQTSSLLQQSNNWILRAWKAAGSCLCWSSRRYWRRSWRHCDVH